MEVWGRVLLALVVPVAWGLASAWVFDRLRLRRECNAALSAAARAESSAPVGLSAPPKDEAAGGRPS
jgi:hypothetical protein